MKDLLAGGARLSPCQDREDLETGSESLEGSFRASRSSVCPPSSISIRPRSIGGREVTRLHHSGVPSLSRKSRDQPEPTSRSRICTRPTCRESEFRCALRCRLCSASRRFLRSPEGSDECNRDLKQPREAVTGGAPAARVLELLVLYAEVSDVYDEGRVSALPRSALGVRRGPRKMCWLVTLRKLTLNLSVREFTPKGRSRDKRQNLSEVVPGHDIFRFGILLPDRANSL